MTAPPAGQVAGRIGSTVPQALPGVGDLLVAAGIRSPIAARAAAIRDELYRILEEISAARRAPGEADYDAGTEPVSMLVGYFRMNQD